MRRSPADALPTVAVFGWVVAVAAFVIVGADTLWAVALGDHIGSTGTIPDGVPFAASPTAGWPNPMVLGELTLAGAHRLGADGLAALQLLIVAGTLGVTAAQVRRRGAGPGATAALVSIVALGILPALVITRMPSLSLLPFAILVALVRADADAPSRRLWWAVPLIAIWGNLHGGVLIGVAVLGAYLLFARLRLRPPETIALGVAALAALWLNPAGPRTFTYYRGVFDNEAAHRGSDLWAPVNLANPLDLLMVLAAVLLIGLAVRRRPARMPWWQIVAALGLIAATVQSARNGTWLLLFLAPLAAQSSKAVAQPATSAAATSRRAFAVGVLVTAAVCGVLLAARGPGPQPPGIRQVPAVAEALQQAGGGAVLASEPFAETLAAGGVTVWASNPLDAFSRPTQAAYLDFLRSGVLTEALMGEVRVVVVPAGSAQAAAMDRADGWVRGPDAGPYAVYLRR